MIVGRRGKLAYRLLIAAPALFPCSNLWARAETRPAATRPNRAAIIEQMKTIRDRISRARDRAEQTEEVQAAQAAMDEIWWRKGNKIQPDFEEKDKKIRKLQEQIRRLTRQVRQLRQELSDVIFKVRRDQQFRAAHTTLQTARRRAIVRVEPQYDQLLKRLRDLGRQLNRSSWPKFRRRPTTRPGR